MVGVWVDWYEGRMASVISLSPHVMGAVRLGVELFSAFWFLRGYYRVEGGTLAI